MIRNIKPDYIFKGSDYTKRNVSGYKFIKKYGGKFLVRGGKHETKEGTNFSRNVVVEFDSYNLALSAYSSSEYKKALEILDGGAQRMYAVVEGYE